MSIFTKGGKVTTRRKALGVQQMQVDTKMELGIRSRIVEVGDGIMNTTPRLTRVTHKILFINSLCLHVFVYNVWVQKGCLGGHLAHQYMHARG